MDLSYSPKYEAFRREVRDFLEKNRECASSGSIAMRLGEKDPKTLEWQRILIEHGYAARVIPREYGGYGPTFPTTRTLTAWSRNHPST